VTSPADELRAAATKLREKVSAARDDLRNSSYFGHDEANYTQGIDNACGGAAGELAASFTPAAGDGLADLLDFIADFCALTASPVPKPALVVVHALNGGQQS